MGIKVVEETNKGYKVKGDIIVINRKLSELDMFIKKFIDVLKRHSDYLIVSGYVSIATGRTRGTEDIDVLVPAMKREIFSDLFNDLIKNGFWCYQGDDIEEVYIYTKNFHNIRFSRVNEIFPNIEFVPIDKKRKDKYFEFTHPQKIKIGNFEFKIPPIEFEILYKEIVLGGKKYIEDARHLRAFFSDIIKEKRFKEYKEIIIGDMK